MNTNDKCVRIWNQIGVVYFKVFPRHSCRDVKKGHKELEKNLIKFRDSNLLPTQYEYRTLYLHNM